MHQSGRLTEELAQDIARRTLLQRLTVRPVLDDEGAETGMFERTRRRATLSRARAFGEAEAARAHNAFQRRPDTSMQYVTARSRNLLQRMTGKHTIVEGLYLGGILPNHTQTK
jgi:hypothetical protein